MSEQETTTDPAREDDDSRPAKRQRNFIARQACEACRAKKTRCDEDDPCSLCRTLGIECIYVQRKVTKNETSMSMIFNTLRRMESKIDHISRPTTSEQPSDEPHQSEETSVTISSNRIDPAIFRPSSASPQLPMVKAPIQPPISGSVISFSAHRTIHWPGIQRSLSPSLSVAVRNLDMTYPTHVESGRASLQPTIRGQATMTTGDWLSSLSISCVKELSNAYFETFNRVYPFVDRDHYFLNTLAVVVREGFGYDIESSLVLNVMALGCLGLKAFQQGGFDSPGHDTLTLLIGQSMDEEIPGLSFFNEARKRVGFCMCDRDIQSCQYYLSSAVFYAQGMRPVDEWMMTNRAAITCAAFWKCPSEPLDEWSADMQSRLFWSALILETVIIQELELPSSGLKEFEDVVPLPKFTVYPYIDSTRARNADDSFYHYHFLAQIAHRIILTRVRDELYFSNPSFTLAEELSHQLEQWRAKLPQALHFAEDDPEPMFDHPADAVVVALLQARYRISNFHLGRPFLYKALQNPASISETDLKMCSQGTAIRHGLAVHMGCLCKHEELYASWNTATTQIGLQCRPITLRTRHKKRKIYDVCITFHVKVLPTAWLPLEHGGTQSPFMAADESPAETLS
ncbi:hypothetical protein LTR10_017467 [Elasticomyces elasticus]|uniref:Zn(2)-C6 fungal-type domain-containing protein n=1 Tax=Exophiala sideris TaxID=1016849 RepID=A0ABR0JAE2_9EURO|nr:hypothetical protein LTR10_017467 [Elasticomyces elasticus]KAK5030351.1 hypothetical protein LTS07_005135 [Exophiala sideris]KAK5038404.1 hypothetical protein LTR13_004151 [Exophiala sideris]KAK5060287.1 hypothetical protein LTR69_005604 [Exophiala sideris]KAK5183198.1 hypothetical protein LTR44_004199 [Eurotiomycetes sp. CCFEE 6388]